jgi:4-amino-4-deoxy-L-arabinose transferase-like glycosyltransferase
VVGAADLRDNRFTADSGYVAPMFTAPRPDVERPRLALPTGIAVVVITGAVMCRFGRAGALSRDESVYLYAGQQLAGGVPPYVSIFDPKGPLSALVIAGGVKLAAVVGVDDISLVRLIFFLISCAGVALIYWLGLELFDAVAPAALAAIVLGTFYRFARDSWSGPDPKTIVVALMLGLLLATIRRRWLVAGALAGLAALTWQPMIFFCLLTAVAAAVVEREQRARHCLASLAGPTLIAGATLTWFAAAGGLGRLIEAALLYPLTGIRHADATWTLRMQRIREVIFDDYGISGYVFVVGLSSFVVLGSIALWTHRGRPHTQRDLAVAMSLGPTFVAMLLYANYDFQGSPDLFPLLPFAALGWAWALSWATGSLAPSHEGLGRRVAAVAVVALTTPLLVYSWVTFATDSDNGQLNAQRRDAARLRMLAGDQRVLALGNPAPLVLAHLTNPDSFIYLSSGVAEWKVDHTEGGLEGWKAQIQAEPPRVVVVDRTRNPLVGALVAWLREEEGYRSQQLGDWRILISTTQT